MEQLLTTAFAAATWLPRATAVLLDIALKGTAVLLVTTAVVLTLRNASASVRHLAWTLGVAGLLSLPVLSAFAPQWTVPQSWVVQALQPSPAPGRAAPAAPSPRAARAPRSSGRELDVPTATTAPATPAKSDPLTSRGYVSAPRAPEPLAVERTASTGAGAEPAPLSAQIAAARRVRWEWWLPGIWLFGAAAALTWFLIGILLRRLLARSARAIDDGPLARALEDAKHDSDVREPVLLLQSDRAVVPMTWGLRPKILLPVDAYDWTDARIRAVLLHELAHVKRRDHLTQLLARFANVLHWFNPLVWYATHRMRVERELACDDRVLTCGPRASEYAGHLLSIARSVGTGFAAAGGIAMARRSGLSYRLLAVLDETRRRAAVTPGLTVTASVLAACVVVPVAGFGRRADAERELPAGMAAAMAPTPAPSPSARPAQPVAPLAAVVRDVPASSNLAQTLVWEPLSETPFAVAQQQRCDWYAREGETSTWMHGEDDDLQIRITVGDCRLDIEASGEIAFNDAETDVASISLGGYFEIEQREGRSRWRIEIVPARGGLERRWSVNGDEREFDDEARAWLAGILPVLFRRAGFQAEDRAERILARDGVDGLLQEISFIPSDYAARKYYQVLLTRGDLDAAGVRRVVRQAGVEIESDYELAELLVAIAEEHPVDETVMVAYVEAAGTLDSDYEQRRVLDAILSREPLSREVAAAMLGLATDLDSDYELAELLIGLLDRRAIDEVTTPEFFEAAATLESDYEHRRVLQALLEVGAPSQDVLDLALESALHLDSDYELAELLVQVAEAYPIEEAMPESYLAAAQSIDSDYELGRVLKYLLDRGGLSRSAFEVVLDAAAKISSDYELANILIEVAADFELDDAQAVVFFRAVGSLGGDYERSRVLQAILDRRPLTEATVEAVLVSSMEIGSEYELASVLVKVAESFTLSEDLHRLFLRAADNVSSDYERGRVLSALTPRRGR